VSGYVMAQVLDAALRKTAGKLSDKPALLAAMKQVKLTTPAGTFRFSEKNEPIQPRYIAQVREVIVPSSRLCSGRSKSLFRNRNRRSCQPISSCRSDP
jgi:hypothetical protein